MELSFNVLLYWLSSYHPTPQILKFCFVLLFNSFLSNLRSEINLLSVTSSFIRHSYDVLPQLRVFAIELSVSQVDKKRGLLDIKHNKLKM